MDMNAGFFRGRPTRGFGNGRQPRRLRCFLHHHDALFSCGRNGEGRPHTSVKGAMASRNRRLDIGRIIVSAANNDEILQAAADKQLSAREVAKVAGAHVVRAVAAVDSSVEGIRGLRLAPPITGGHRRPRDPDLARLAFRDGPPGFGVDNHSVAPWPSGALRADRQG